MPLSKSDFWIGNPFCSVGNLIFGIKKMTNFLISDLIINIEKDDKKNWIFFLIDASGVKRS